MNLTEFSNKEKIINKKLFRKKIISDIFFEEINFENELFTYSEEIKDFEYGWYDVETHEVDFDELNKIEDGELMKGLIKKIKKHCE